MAELSMLRSLSALLDMMPGCERIAWMRRYRLSGGEEVIRGHEAEGREIRKGENTTKQRPVDRDTR